MPKSETLNELAGSLAKAQGAFTAAEREHTARVNSKKGEGSSYSYNYADLAAYLDVCREPLASNGLAIIQSVKAEGTKATVTTTILHASGQWYESDPLTLECASDGLPAAQAIGSIITYARRYSLSATIGMASEADDDANSGSGNNAETGRKESNLPACPKCGTNKSVIVGKAEYGGGFLCFAKKGGCGEKWQAGERLREEMHNEVDPHEQPKGTRIAKADAKKKADELAAQHGVTTADQLPPTKFGKFDTMLADAADDDALEEIAVLIPKKKDWDLKDKTIAWSKWFRRAVVLGKGNLGRLEFLQELADDKLKTAVIDHPIKSAIDADLAIAFAGPKN